LRQVLVKHEKTEEESDMLRTTLASYSSYLSSGRKREEIAWMIARDFMLLSQPKNQSAHSASFLIGSGGALSTSSGVLGASQAASQSHPGTHGEQGLGTLSGTSNAAASFLFGGQHASSSLYSLQPYAFRSLTNSNLHPTQHNK
jgi:hypothetical protein